MPTRRPFSTTGRQPILRSVKSLRGLDQRGIWLDGDDLGGHHVFDGERVEQLPLGVLAIAKRLRERVAKEIALGHDTDEESDRHHREPANGEPALGA